MENAELSALDPDHYERIYICHICNGISTEPECSNNHALNVDFESFIQPTVLSTTNHLVNAKVDRQEIKICAIIPRFNINQQPQNQHDYLCPVCGDVSPHVECKRSHTFRLPKDICHMCGTEFESIEEMMQHCKCCKLLTKCSIENSIINIVPQCGAFQVYNVVQPFALYLPENFATMVQKGSLGIGQYQVVAALIDANSSIDENISTLPNSVSNSAHNILEWDESMEVAGLGMDNPSCEVLDNAEGLIEPNICEPVSYPVQIEPPKPKQLNSTIDRDLDGHKPLVNRRQLCCVTCEMELLDVDTLISHYLAHGSSTFICQFCLRRYSRSHWFKVHMKSHAHELAIVCPLCDDSFLSTKLYEEHLKTVHSLDVPEITKTLLDHQKNAFMCMECGRWLKSEKHLDSHRQMHKTMGRPVQSQDMMMTADQPIWIDGQNTVNSANAKPTNTDLSNQGPKKPVHVFECNICLATIKSIEEIRQHMISHDAQRFNKCTACNERFTTTTQVHQHKCMTHGSHSNTCPECSKVFTHAAGLSCHLKAEHQVEAFSCDKCQLKFKMLSSYLVHRARYH